MSMLVLLAFAGLAAWLSHRSGFKAGGREMERYYLPIVEAKIREGESALAEGQAYARAEMLRAIAEMLSALEIADTEGANYNAEKVRFLMECELNPAGRNFGEIPHVSAEPPDEDVSS
jgi:hypothetical protein